jgi:hypothetical protein
MSHTDTLAVFFRTGLQKKNLRNLPSARNLLGNLPGNLQGLPRNLLREFAGFFSGDVLGNLPRDLLVNLRGKYASENCWEIAGKMPGNLRGEIHRKFCWRNFHLFPFTPVILWEGIQQQSAKTLTGLLFAKSSCRGIMGIPICRDEYVFLNPYLNGEKLFIALIQSLI